MLLAPFSEIPFYRYSLTWRQYFPLIDNDVLTFAYRLNYEGTIGSHAPFYALSYISVVGEQIDKEGMGGADTGRGLMRCRVVGSAEISNPRVTVTPSLKAFRASAMFWFQRVKRAKRQRSSATYVAISRPTTRQRIRPRPVSAPPIPSLSICSPTTEM